VADDGYRFDHWERALAGNPNNPATIVMDADKAVEAKFVQTDIGYTITTSVAPAEGGEVHLQPPEDPEGYTKDTQVSLTAIANAGFEFNHWEGDLTGSMNPVSIVMDGNKTITAAFEPRYVLTVSVDPAGGGTVALDPSQSPYGYLEGTQVTVTAVATDGYRFDHWSGALSGSENPATVTVSAAREVVASFSKLLPWRGILGGVIGGAFIVILPSYLVIRRLRSGAGSAHMR